MLHPPSSTLCFGYEVTIPLRWQQGPRTWNRWHFLEITSKCTVIPFVPVWDLAHPSLVVYHQSRVDKRTMRANEEYVELAGLTRDKPVALFSFFSRNIPPDSTEVAISLHEKLSQGAILLCVQRQSWNAGFNVQWVWHVSRRLDCYILHGWYIV
jgi:hypothetical protein